MNALTSTWGPDGILSHESLTRELVTSTREWMEGDLCLDDLRGIEAFLPQRRNLAMVVNNECNLSCSHCFLQIPSLSRKRLTVAEWDTVLASAVRKDLGQYLIVGKEVLMGKTGPEVISMLGGLRSQRPLTRTGLVTNGTLLHKHTELISNAALSHIDISMEGAPEDHDFIRGAGAFSAVRANVEWAAALLRRRLFVTMTLQRHNVRRLDRAIQAFAAMGVQSVGISPFEPLSYTDTSLALSSEDFQFFLANLNQLGRLNLPHEMLVQVDTCSISPEMLIHFIESKWFDLESMRMDGTGFLYSSHRLENGLNLVFRFLPWPLSLDFHTRISADGDVLCAADGYLARAYSVNSLANVRDFDFDFGAAFRAASMHPRLNHLEAKFEAEVAPRIRAAYRSRTRSATVVHARSSNRPVRQLVPSH